MKMALAEAGVSSAMNRLLAVELSRLVYLNGGRGKALVGKYKKFFSGKLVILWLV